MRAAFVDCFAGVGRASHRGDDVAGFDRFAGGEAGLDFAQMRVERINFQAFDNVPDDNVFAVVGQRGLGADINHRAISGGQDGIGRFAVAVGVLVQNVE